MIQTAVQPVPVAHGSRISHELRVVRVLWKREMLRFLRRRAEVVTMLINPVLFLVVLGVGLGAMLDGGDRGGDYVAYVFPGVLMMAIQAPALSAGGSIVRDREFGFLRGMLVAPAGRGTLLIGKCLGGATSAAVQAGLLLVLAPLAGVSYDPLVMAGLFAELILISLTMTFAGAFFAVFVKRIETFQTMASFSMMPLFLLSGALFPVGGLPGWLSALTLANPLTYAVDAMRRTTSASQDVSGPEWGGWVPPVGLELVVMLLISLTAMIFAARRFARAD